jgi:hypothetical protein
MLYVDGDMMFDEKIKTTQLNVDNIWVRMGRLMAGNKTHPFKS